MVGQWSPSCKDRKHMFVDTFFQTFHVCLGLHVVVMIAGIHVSQELFAIAILTALKPSLEHDPKDQVYVMRLLRPYGPGGKGGTCHVCIRRVCMPSEVSLESHFWGSRGGKKFQQLSFCLIQFRSTSRIVSYHQIYY